MEYGAEIREIGVAVQRVGGRKIVTTDSGRLLIAPSREVERLSVGELVINGEAPGILPDGQNAQHV